MIGQQFATSDPDLADMWTLTRCAHEARVSERTIQNWIKCGLLFSVKVGNRRLVPRPSLEAMLRSTGRAS